jgi:aminoglycoside phosphotransferase (APT) family kinase protein
MGLIDSYPDHGENWQSRLLEIEKQCIEWRWKLKPRVHRLRQVHGDFHPWNILFSRENDICLLDRSRGEWGDAADDVTCLTMNYVFFSLQRSERLEGAFGELFARFWKRYLEAAGDSELLEVAAPFLAFRGLVMAHPVWYPHLSDAVRSRLFNFISSVLDTPAFDPSKVNQYCEA